jgi:predicted secreted protein
MADRGGLSRRRVRRGSIGLLAPTGADGRDASESRGSFAGHAIPFSGFHGREESRRDWSKDPRSRKVLFLSHCILNQNSRIVGCADFPAVFEPLLLYLQKSRLGLIQMPCPELYCLGLGRTDVRPGLESNGGMARMEFLIDDLIFTIREYLFQGFRVVGILGKEGSPACGVTTTWRDERIQDGEGVWVEEIRKRLAREQLDVPMIGVLDHQQEKTIEWLEREVQGLDRRGT